MGAGVVVKDMAGTQTSFVEVKASSAQVVRHGWSSSSGVGIERIRDFPTDDFLLQQALLAASFCKWAHSQKSMSIFLLFSCEETRLGDVDIIHALFERAISFDLPPKKTKVTDLTWARENQTDFQEYLRNNPNANPGIDLMVTVLATGFWPSYKSFDLNL